MPGSRDDSSTCFNRYKSDYNLVAVLKILHIYTWCHSKTSEDPKSDQRFFPLIGFVVSVVFNRRRSSSTSSLTSHRRLHGNKLRTVVAAASHFIINSVDIWQSTKIEKKEGIIYNDHLNCESQFAIGHFLPRNLNKEIGESCDCGRRRDSFDTKGKGLANKT